jgi:hypothetical protein
VAHVARMRIVLAQRSCDLAQLERARPVLQRLGDRQFLRRLEEVANCIQSGAPQPGKEREPAHTGPSATQKSEPLRRIRQATEA